MNLEYWLYRRDREEYILSFRFLFGRAMHLCRQQEAEQEIERMLRA